MSAILATPAIASEKRPVLQKDTPYAIARARLIATGTVPAPWPYDARADCDSDERCQAYPERINCSGDGAVACLFRWKTKSGLVFLVLTSGETVARLKVDRVVEPLPDDLHPMTYEHPSGAERPSTTAR